MKPVIHKQKYILYNIQKQKPVHWEETCRRRQVISPSPGRASGSFKFTYNQKYVSSFSRASNLFFISFKDIVTMLLFFCIGWNIFSNLLWGRVGPMVDTEGKTHGIQACNGLNQINYRVALIMSLSWSQRVRRIGEQNGKSFKSFQKTKKEKNI